MLNKKVETLLAVILWLAILYSFILLVNIHLKEISKEYNVSQTIEDYRLAVLICTCLIHRLLMYLYVKCRNQHFLNKVYNLYTEKKYDEALVLIDNTIKQRPEIQWLKTEKATMLVFTGNYTLYISYKDALGYPKNYLKRANYYRLEVINYSFEFLSGKEDAHVSSLYINNKRWKKYITGFYYDLYMAIYEYQSGDFMSAIHFSNKLLIRRFSYLKYIACVILIKSYKETENCEMEGKYKELLAAEHEFI